MWKYRFPFRGSEDGFERYTRLLHKHAEKCLAIFDPSEVTGVADEEAGCLPESFEAILCVLEDYCISQE